MTFSHSVFNEYDVYNYEYGFWKSVSNLMAEVDVLLENCAKSAILQTFKCVHDAYFSLN